MISERVLEVVFGMMGTNTLGNSTMMKDMVTEHTFTIMVRFMKANGNLI